MKAFFHRPQSVFARRALFQVHLWTGIIIGLYIFVVCATGAVLVFRIDLQRALHPDLFTPSSDGPQVDPLVVMEAVRHAYPHGRLSGVDAPTTARPTYLAYASVDDRFLTLLLDPITGRLLGELPENSLLRTVQDLHFDLLAGNTGRTVNGIGAILLFAMCLTGLIIWWPGVGTWRRGFSVDFRRSWKRINWDLHSAFGIWTVVVIATWAITGVYFAFPSRFRAAINVVSPVTTTRTPRSSAPATGQAVLPWRQLIDTARQHSPDRFVARIVVPSTDRAAFLVMLSEVRPTPVGTTDLESVYLDQYTGELLTEPPRARRSAGDLIMASVAPLHVGSFGGLPVRLAWLIIGFSPPLLFVTGFIMWWTRVVRPR